MARPPPTSLRSANLADWADGTTTLRSPAAAGSAASLTLAGDGGEFPPQLANTRNAHAAAANLTVFTKRPLFLRSAEWVCHHHDGRSAGRT